MISWTGSNCDLFLLCLYLGTLDRKRLVRTAGRRNAEFRIREFRPLWPGVWRSGLAWSARLLPAPCKVLQRGAALRRAIPRLFASCTAYFVSHQDNGQRCMDFFQKKAGSGWLLRKSTQHFNQLQAVGFHLDTLRKPVFTLDSDKWNTVTLGGLHIGMRVTDQGASFWLE